MRVLHPWELHTLADSAVPSKDIGKSFSVWGGVSLFNFGWVWGFLWLVGWFVGVFFPLVHFLCGSRISHVPSCIQTGSAQLISFAGEKEEFSQLRGLEGRTMNLSLPTYLSSIRTDRSSSSLWLE